MKDLTPMMLTLVALGLLMGARDMKNIHRKVTPLNQRQRETIGLKIREKNGSGRNFSKSPFVGRSFDVRGVSSHA